MHTLHLVGGACLAAAAVCPAHVNKCLAKRGWCMSFWMLLAAAAAAAALLIVLVGGACVCGATFGAWLCSYSSACSGLLRPEL